MERYYIFLPSVSNYLFMTAVPFLKIVRTYVCFCICISVKIILHFYSNLLNLLWSRIIKITTFSMVSKKSSCVDEDQVQKWTEMGSKDPHRCKLNFDCNTGQFFLPWMKMMHWIALGLSMFFSFVHNLLFCYICDCVYFL